MQEKYDEIKSLLQYHYSGKSFPYKLVYTIFKDAFREREFCFYTFIDNKEKWERGKSFFSADAMKEQFTKCPPHSAYNGAIYRQPVEVLGATLKSATPVKTDLVFDIDID